MTIPGGIVSITETARIVQHQTEKGIVIVETLIVRRTAVFKQLNEKLTPFFRMVPCHRKKERCLCIQGEAMPICARCLFILIGMLTVPFFLFSPLPLMIGVALQVPMVLDGWTQLKGWRKSSNGLRMTTGLTSGIGLAIGITALFWLVADWMDSFQ